MSGNKKIPGNIVLEKALINKPDENKDILTQNNLVNTVISPEIIVEEINKLSVQDQSIRKIDDKKKEEEKEEEVKISAEKMDEYIYEVFLTTIKICITIEMLPMDPGKLYKEYMKKVASELKVPLDIKLSTHKKINNYLKSISKSHKIITFGKPSSSQTNEYILSIHRDNPL